MSNQTVEAEPESDYFANSRTKTFKAIEDVAVETFTRDRGDFLDELAKKSLSGSASTVWLLIVSRSRPRIE